MTKNVCGVFVGAPQEQRGGDAANHSEGNFVAALFRIVNHIAPWLTGSLRVCRRCAESSPVVVVAAADVSRDGTGSNVVKPKVRNKQKPVTATCAGERLLDSSLSGAVRSV